jgi:hypothetical protein
MAPQSGAGKLAFRLSYQPIIGHRLPLVEKVITQALSLEATLQGFSSKGNTLQMTAANSHKFEDDYTGLVKDIQAEYHQLWL